MASLISLEGYEPTLQAYLKHHHYPAVLEVGGAGGRAHLLLCVLNLQALMSGLCVMTPADPWEFVKEKILELMKSGKLSEVHWWVWLGRIHAYHLCLCMCVFRDMFIDLSKFPEPSRFRRGMLEALMDESDQVCETCLLACLDS